MRTWRAGSRHVPGSAVEIHRFPRNACVRDDMGARRAGYAGVVRRDHGRINLSSNCSACATAHSEARMMLNARSCVGTRLARSVLRESAGPVAAGTPLVEIGDVTRLEIRADLLSSDATPVQVGAAATVTSWGGPSFVRRLVGSRTGAACRRVARIGS